MTLPTLAPVSSLEVRLGLSSGSLSGADLARAQAALSDVSDLIRHEAGGRSWVAADNVTVTAPASVVAVAVLAALRVYRNPDGFASEALGGGAYGYSYAPGSTGAYLSEDEIRIVRRAAMGTMRSLGTFSVRTPSAYVITGGVDDALL